MQVFDDILKFDQHIGPPRCVDGIVRREDDFKLSSRRRISEQNTTYHSIVTGEKALLKFIERVGP
jgi:hypothetical protein